MGAGIEEVSEAVANEVEGEDAEGEGGGGEEDEVGGVEEVGASVVEHGSPCGGGRLDAEAEEAEGGFGEYGACHADGGLHEQGLNDVGKNVAEHEVEVGGSEGAGGLNVFTLFDCHDLSSNEAGVVDPTGEGESEDEIDEAGAEEGDEGDGEKYSGEGEEGVGEIDVDDGVGEATVEARDHAEDCAEDERDGDDGDGDGEGDAGAEEDTGEDVAAELVGAKEVGGRGW